MSTAERLISGSLASWARIGVTIMSQVVLVPVYLTYWNVETYGIWIAILALANMLVNLDLGHQEFLSFEFMRIGKENRLLLSQYLWSGIMIGITISLFQLVLMGVFLGLELLPYLLGESDSMTPSILRTAGIVLLLQGTAWLIGTSITGLLFRVLAPFGHYPRMAWWNFFGAIICSVAPVIAVMLGGDLLLTGIVLACTSIGISIPIYFDLIRLLHKEKILFSPPSWKVGTKNFIHSLAIVVKISLDNIRQQGVRIVLAPLSGATGLAAFSTMRTGANIALQGLNTITQPLMPDLMRFLQQRDQARSESAFGTVWLVVVALLTPAIVVFQAIIEPFFISWTRGQIPFDPWLFAILSLTVLVYAVVQPASTVVVGNNLLKPQLIISSITSLTVVIIMYMLVPKTGIIGAGIALLAGEIITTIGFKIVAQRWLHQNGLKWPKRPFILAVLSVLNAAVTMSIMIYIPQAKWPILGLSFLLSLINLWFYWQVLPAIATQYTLKFISNIPGLKSMFTT
jgi:O-antigen/teichoic acid export membrane protein